MDYFLLFSRFLSVGKREKNSEDIVNLEHLKKIKI